MNERVNDQPWGRVAGLLTACLATLVGIGCGLEPETILLRAGVAAVVVGITVAWAVCLARIFGKSP